MATSRFSSVMLICLLWNARMITCSFPEVFGSRQYTTNATIPGFVRASPARSAVFCGHLSALCNSCQTFAYNSGNHTCWLYDHLVEYTTVGTAAPGTRYFWRLSPRCPTELGYTLEDNVCYKLHEAWLIWTEAKEICRNEGGVLFFEVTKLALLRNKLKAQTWVGGTDAEAEGSWFWFNGKSLPTGSPLWEESQPDDMYSRQDGLLLQTDGKLDDFDDEFRTAHAACQIPMAPLL